MREHAKSNESLLEAFETFSQESQRLQTSYQSLESRVTSLSNELQATQALRSHELAEKERLADRLVTLLSTLPAGVIVVDDKGLIRELNAAATQLLAGCTVGQRFDQALPGLEYNTINNSCEIVLPDGRIISVSRQALEIENSTILLLADITDRVLLERQTSHQERLTSMGEMAAKLAHQIRTPLSSALLYASNLRNTHLPETQRADFAKRIQEGLHSLNVMVNDMLAFSKNEMTSEECISIRYLIEDVEQSLKLQLREAGAEWAVETDQDDYFIAGNHSLLKGALSNLVINAIHATGDGVKIQWDVRNEKDSIYLSIEDNGPGIEKKDADKIFEPFFTTRNNGTGLGLAVVSTVIQAHKGTIKVDTENTHSAGMRLTMKFPYLNKSGILASSIQRCHKENTGTKKQACL
ncbi:MAG: ATP-binding protein [Gammaproteobacteria bacterium]